MRRPKHSQAACMTGFIAAFTAIIRPESERTSAAPAMEVATMEIVVVVLLVLDPRRPRLACGKAEYGFARARTAGPPGALDHRDRSGRPDHRDQQVRRDRPRRPQFLTYWTRPRSRVSLSTRLAGTPADGLTASALRHRPLSGSTGAMPSSCTSTAWRFASSARRYWCRWT